LRDARVGSGEQAASRLRVGVRVVGNTFVALPSLTGMRPFFPLRARPTPSGSMGTGLPERFEPAFVDMQ
jgi:hypothetical protein